jgi:hypothetical protein
MNISFLTRDIPIRPENSPFLSSPYFKNNRAYNYSKEDKFKSKSNLLMKEENNKNEIKYSKFSNNINLIIDYKKNLSKKKLTNFNHNYLCSYSHYIDTEPNKPRANKLFSENKDICKNNALSTTSFYSNKNLTTRMPIKKSKSFINFNDEIPKEENIFSNHGRNMNLILNNNLNNISKNKYQSYTNLKKIINYDFPKFPDLSTDRDNNYLNKKFPNYSNKLGQKNKNYTQRNNLYSTNLLSTYGSNLYLNTENNINSKNSNCNNHKNNRNYNMMNIVSPKPKSNEHSNINSFQKTQKFSYHNYINLLNLQKNKINNSDIQNIKKYKHEKNFSSNNFDKIMNKTTLNQFYEDTFNNINDDHKINVKNMSNNDDILYRENLTTNQSTCTNGTNKIKNMKKTAFSKLNINKQDSNVENFEELHFSIVSSIQDGKKYAKKFN